MSTIRRNFQIRNHLTVNFSQFTLKFKFLMVLLMGFHLSYSQDLDGFESVIYKSIETVELRMHFKYPDEMEPGKEYPAIVFFFGGGWNRWSVTQFVPHANHFSKLGMISIIAEYRVKSKHNSTVFESVADAKSAMRFLHSNFKQFSIDTTRLAASGGSAGGHLAAATAAISGLNEQSDDLTISTMPDALVLFNPVIDNGPGGFGVIRIGDRYPEISPMHNIRPGLPPTIIFLGTNDQGIPVETMQKYKQLMENNGNRCDLFLYEGQQHGFFNYNDNSTSNNKYYYETIKEAENFLRELGFMN